jgi:MHS family alpha-ketoglutarate permease-like MFS transporter
VGLGYAIANSLFGGTVPLIGAALQKAGQEELFFTYVTVAIGISLLVYIFALKNKKSTHLDHEQGHAWAAAGPSDGAAVRPGAAARPGDGGRDEDEDLLDASRR